MVMTLKKLRNEFLSSSEKLLELDAAYYNPLNEFTDEEEDAMIEVMDSIEQRLVDTLSQIMDSSTQIPKMRRDVIKEMCSIGHIHDTMRVVKKLS